MQDFNALSNHLLFQICSFKALRYASRTPNTKIAVNHFLFQICIFKAQGCVFRTPKHAPKTLFVSLFLNLFLRVLKVGYCLRMCKIKDLVFFTYYVVKALFNAVFSVQSTSCSLQHAGQRGCLTFIMKASILANKTGHCIYKKVKCPCQ